MKCAWAQEQLLLYLAGELEPQITTKLLQHLEQCGQCAAMAERLAEMQAKVEASLQPSLQASASLDARIMDAVRSLPARKQIWPELPDRTWFRRVSVVLTAACLLAIGFFLGRASTPGNSGREGLLPLYLTTLRTAHQQSAASEYGPDALAQKLAPQVQFAVPVVDLQPEGAQLAGGSKTSLQGVPVAHLSYIYKGEMRDRHALETGLAAACQLRAFGLEIHDRNGELHLRR